MGKPDHLGPDDYRVHKQCLAKIGSTVNPDARSLLVYYPGWGGDDEVARCVRASRQVGVDMNDLDALKLGTLGRLRSRDITYIHEDDFGEYIGRARIVSRAGMFKRLELIHYGRKNATKFFPLEIQSGFDVLINKRWEGDWEYEVVDTEFKHRVYNLLRPGGFEILWSQPPIFVELCPEVFGFHTVIRPDKSYGGSVAASWTVSRRDFTEDLPLELFEIDKILVTDTPGMDGKGLFYDCFHRTTPFIRACYESAKDSSNGIGLYDLPRMKEFLDRMDQKRQFFLENEDKLRRIRLVQLTKRAKEVPMQGISNVLIQELERILG